MMSTPATDRVVRAARQSTTVPKTDEVRRLREPPVDPPEDDELSGAASVFW